MSGRGVGEGRGRGGGGAHACVSGCSKGISE